MPGIAPETRMGSVHLTVSNIGRSLDYYERVVGLQVHEREDGTARLGTGGEDLLVLHEQPGAEPAPRNTGLFHFALLLPSRHDLARWLARAVKQEVRFEGMSDPLVSEAVYLGDPDWHGIEIYRDRPRDEWERDGEFVRMATLPLDVQGVLSALDGAETELGRLPRDPTMGHAHLQVADIGASESFYTGQIGFDVQARYGDQATFMSAGGYHHHVGGNVWNSRGASPPPAGSAALRHFTVLLPDEQELERVAARIPGAVRADGGGVAVEDPSRNKLLLA